MALFAAVLMIIGLTAFRRGPAELSGPVAVMGSAVILASSAALLALIGFVVIWRTGRRGVGASLGGLFLAALLLAYPGFLAAKAVQLPEINDVSDRSDGAAGLFVVGARSSGAVRRALRHDSGQCPHGAARCLPGHPAHLARSRGRGCLWPRGEGRHGAWLAHRRSAVPGGRGGLGHVDAVDRSNFLGLPGDITIRLRPLVDQTRIDVALGQPLRRHDFGSNAQRIQRFAQELQAQLDDR